MSEVPTASPETVPSRPPSSESGSPPGSLAGSEHPAIAKSPAKRGFWRLPRVFITYRRRDSGGTALYLYRSLADHYDEKNVFRDVDSIHAGEEFMPAIERGLRRADVQLVLIGKQWLTITGADGVRRLDAPNDYVRREIEIGLASKLRVIPVIVDEAELPAATALPESIRGLLNENARFLRDTRPGEFDDGVAELIDQIGHHGYRILGLPRRAFVAVITFVALVVASVFGFFALRGPGRLSGPKFNVAVADFVFLDEQGREQKSALAKTVQAEVLKRLRSLSPDVTSNVRYLGESAGRVDGSTDRARILSAARLREKRGADALFFATVEMHEGQVYVIPGVSISERRLGRDLADQFEKEFRPTASGPFVTSTSGLIVAKDTANEVVSTIRMLASLSQFRSGYQKLAADLVRPLLDRRAEPGWDRSSNPERNALVHYVLGLAAMQSADARPSNKPPTEWFAAAIDELDAALQADPEFIRGTFARDQIDYIRGKGTCSAPTVKDSLLRPALVRSRSNAEAAESIGDDRVRAQWLAGLLSECRASAGLQTRAEARTWFQAVVDSPHAEGDTADLASIAYGRLAWISATEDYDYQRAEDQMTKAIALRKQANLTRLALTVGSSNGAADIVAALESQLDCIRTMASMEQDVRRRGNATDEALAAFRSAEIAPLPCRAAYSAR